MSLEERVLYHLKHEGSLTPLEALDKFHTMRLSSAIHKLRRQGEPIKTITVKTENKKTYAKYVMENHANLPQA